MSTAMSRRLDQLTAAVENSVVFWTILAGSAATSCPRPQGFAPSTVPTPAG